MTVHQNRGRKRKRLFAYLERRAVVQGIVLVCAKFRFTNIGLESDIVGVEFIMADDTVARTKLETSQEPVFLSIKE